MQVREAKNVFGQMLNSDACRPAAPLPFPTATRQLMDLFLPSLAVMLNTLFTCKATTTPSTQPSTPSKCLHQLWRILQGGKAAAKSGPTRLRRMDAITFPKLQGAAVTHCKWRTPTAATRGRSVRGEVPGRKWRREKRGKEMDGGRGWISLCSCEMSLQSIKPSGWTDEPIRPR